MDGRVGDPARAARGARPRGRGGGARAAFPLFKYWYRKQTGMQFILSFLVLVQGVRAQFQRHHCSNDGKYGVVV